ncbi:MAG: 16S rRNA (cytidine(1402)-2'-O)-methyltransferase [Deltaproteobacteria bacterium]|nr:16S rRNA (cytidine(1402)-2'-O)-methyltransferase [Deltaproteobacteria bacterium]
MALYVVATPIGNIEDITLRALKVLKDVGLIAAEDTRHTKKLLAHYGIGTPVTSYYEHNEREKAPYLLERLKGGVDMALVSDAGTPGISDPGYRLIRLACEEGVRVISVPGPSALMAVLSIAGLPTDEFTFRGFMPARQAERRRFLAELKGADSTFVMYESPRRLKAALDDIKAILADAEVAVGREITKLHEEVIRGTVDRVIGELAGRDVKGEVTVVLRTGKKAPADGETLSSELREMLSAGVPLKDAVKAVASALGMPKSMVYKEALKYKGS